MELAQDASRRHIEFEGTETSPDPPGSLALLLAALLFAALLLAALLFAALLLAVIPGFLASLPSLLPCSYVARSCCPTPPASSTLAQRPSAHPCPTPLDSSPAVARTEVSTPQAVPRAVMGEDGAELSSHSYSKA
jgi:hypothetical protein